MEIVSTRFGNDIDHPAGVLTVFRAVIAGLHAEFLQRVGKGKGLVDVGVFVHVVAAVELVADRILPSSVCRIGHRTGKSLGRALVSATVGGIDGASHQQSEGCRVAAVEW